MRSGIAVIFGVFFSIQAWTQWANRLPVFLPSLPGYSSRHADVLSASVNPAALVHINSFSMAVSAQRKFMQADLNLFNIITCVPSSLGNVGLELFHFGFDSYKESIIGLAYAKKLGQKASAGVQFNFYNLAIASYGKLSAVSGEMGAMLQIAEKLYTGIHLNNTAKLIGSRSDELNLPLVITSGWGYEASEKVLLNAELIKEQGQSFSFHGGMQYKPLPLVLIKAGIFSSTSTYWCGVGVTMASLRLDFISSFHPQLGVSPGLIIIYKSKAKESK